MDDKASTPDTSNVDGKDSKVRKGDKGLFHVQFGVEDVPAWYQCILYGLQHYLTSFGSVLSIVLLVSARLCVGNDQLASSEILGTLLFVSGIITLLQTTLGVRLPIVQGGSFAFVVPTLAILSLEKWKCPNIIDGAPTTDSNTTQAPLIFTGSDEHREVWQTRMREIQGAILLSSLFQILIGFTGLMGVLLRFIGPLTVTPVTVLIGLSLFKASQNYSEKNWPIAILTLALVAVFSQHMGLLKIPCCVYKRASRSCTRKSGYPLFKLFSVMLAISITWLLCYILTITNVFPDNKEHWAYGGRTDVKANILQEAKWFRFPYPGQWGTPTISTGAVFGMLAGVMAGIAESIGDYYACARASGAPPPPIHAVNRGIFVEGIGCLLAGAWGTGTGTTSYSQNTGTIAITKVGSRRVVQVCAAFMLIFGVFGKFGAFFVSIPEPIIGGLFMSMFGMIVAVGISNLQFVNLNSSRNLFTLGIAIFVGLMVPDWMTKNPGIIKTGDHVADQICTVLLSTSMFVGGLIGLILDNTIPGSRADRGLLRWREFFDDAKDGDSDNASLLRCYDLPFVTPWLARRFWTGYIPVCPAFNHCASLRKRWTESEPQNFQDVIVNPVVVENGEAVDQRDTKIEITKC